MDTNTLLVIFIAVTSIAVIIQMGVMIGLFVSVKKTGERVRDLADKVESTGLPAVEAARSLMVDSKPRVEEVVKNVSDTVAMVRNQAQRIELTLSDVVDRTRLQVIRADEMVTRAMDRVEQTTEAVAHSVVSPVRQVSGVFTGLATGINAFFSGAARNRDRTSAPRDEMFI
jgi:hypothetical protein